jgi:energy-coupling factor transporter ATP-binding protein EcfA2
MVQGLTKRFGDVLAVDGLDFEVEEGTVVGFLGPNGAGKTTALRMLLGLVASTAGTATFGGRAYRELGAPTRVVGAVLEASGFHPGRTARNHLRVLATAAGLPARRVDKVLARSASPTPPTGGSAASRSACASASGSPLLKLRTTRVVAGLFGLTIATSALIATAVMLIATRPGQPPIPSHALPELLVVAEGPMVVFALILGVLAMTGEFRHGTATPTFLVTPDRGRVVAAKVVANALAGALLAILSAAVVLAVTLPWLRVRGVHLVILDADAGARLLGLLATAALHAVLGVGLGALVRNQVVAVAAGLVWMRVEAIIPDALQRPGLGRWLPEGAASALTGPGASTLPIWAGGLLLAAYGVALALLGTRLVVRRDLT